VLGAWCGKKDLGKKIGHLEDRTLSDVAEVKTFEWGSKGRVTSRINVSPPKNLTPWRVQRIKLCSQLSESLNGYMP